MRRLFAALLVFVAALLPTMSAGAAPSASLHVSPSTVPAGGSVKVSGTCEASSGGSVISHAFLHDATHDFAGIGAVQFETDAAGDFSAVAQIPRAITPGAYDVTARCGGGNLGISLSLTVTTGAPTGVPAGSGGLAVPTRVHTNRQQTVLFGAGLALLGICGLVTLPLRRTRR